MNSGETLCKMSARSYSNINHTSFTKILSVIAATFMSVKYHIGSAVSMPGYFPKVKP